MKSDNEILTQFFSEARTPIADDGFTARVMHALPRQARIWHISRINLWLNMATAAASVALVIYFVISQLSHVVAAHHPTLLHDNSSLSEIGTKTFYVTVMHILTRLNTLAEGLQVQLYLYLHRLPDMLPSLTQILALAAMLIILTAYSLSHTKRQGIAKE